MHRINFSKIPGLSSLGDNIGLARQTAQNIRAPVVQNTCCSKSSKHSGITEIVGKKFTIIALFAFRLSNHGLPDLNSCSVGLPTPCTRHPRHFKPVLQLGDKATQLDFNLALLSLGSTKRFIPPGVFNSVLCIESQPTSFQDRLDRYKHMFSKTLLDDGYLALLFDWLASFSDGTTPVSDQVFANAAVYCMDYLYTLGRRRRTPSISLSFPLFSLPCPSSPKLLVPVP